jgi:hypothetical protein
MLLRGGGYDILRCCVLLWIVVGMMSVHIMHVFNCTVVDILMTQRNANLYVLLVRSPSYFRV